MICLTAARFTKRFSSPSTGYCAALRTCRYSVRHDLERIYGYSSILGIDFSEEFRRSYRIA